MSNPAFYTYVSTRADYDPAKTIFVFPPAEQAKDIQAAQNFAYRSGWETLAEYDGAVLIVPVAPNGWEKEDVNLPGRIYDGARNNHSSRNGHSLFGRGGKLWCWETMIYLVGYGDGAVFAGNCAVAYPGRFAAVALVGGVPDDFSQAAAPSEHSFVRNVSHDYQMTNDCIASCVWILGVSRQQAEPARACFAAAAQAHVAEDTQLCGIKAQRWYAPEAPAQQILISEGEFNPGLELSRCILNGLFDRVIRWKDGPDGTLCFHPSREEYYMGQRFIVDSVCVNALDYPYGIHLPVGKSKEDVAGLPLVFSVHGRGEPAWLFSTKNGWDTLADETGEFVLAIPDSPGNVWKLERDGEAFPAMVEKICAEYHLDRTRVYLTGFSNGGSITREVGTNYPHLFAAISPWNGPVKAPGLVTHQAISPKLLEEGYEMPCWICAGDNDPVTTPSDSLDQLEPLLAANHCAAQRGEDVCGFIPHELWQKEYYTPQKGYVQGDRFSTRVFRDTNGEFRVGYTIMKNMPHGAIKEQSRAAWEFLRVFSRPQGSRNVKLLP